MATDRKTLAWVKTCINEHLDDVFHAPDDFIVNPNNTDPIAKCIEPLKLVKGALEIIGVSGATMLANELIILAQNIVDGKVTQKNDAAEALATGILQLPGYLESLYHGQPDIPIILLPILNDIRAVQDLELLTEGEFFAPDLDVTAPLQPVSECIVSGDIVTVAKKLRPGYLSGLLGVIRDDNVTENIEKLILVIDNLLIASDSEKARQLWWVALGVIESLYENALDKSIALKILLGRVDRYIQRIIEHGERALEIEPADKIIKNLLFYVGQAETYNNRVIEIKKSFRLELPESSVIEKARENLYSFNSNLIETISTQVKDEINAIKDALEVSAHSKAGSTEGLQPILKQFSTIADALGMLGMNSQKDFIVKQRNFVDSLIVQNKSLTDDDMMGIAAALLHVEGSLQELGSVVCNQGDGSISPADFEKSLKLVSKEILKEINMIKDEVQLYSKDIGNQNLLQQTPDTLYKLIGAMHVLKHDSQSSLTNSISDFIRNEILTDDANISTIQMDLLADAITGIENYYETILEESVAPELGLQIAARSLTKLGYAPTEVAYNPNYNDMIPQTA